ncbi:hypothetical protein [Variovorax boronicumulans]|uniref:hypothetical protein n=1 Tax=Variovorax boronicumulans TaxID=436515 RepID=UPI002475D46C|nr:hypothetical protein [Variovorax boronicumulans]
MSAVKAMGADTFARHATGRLRDQLTQPQSANLVRLRELRIDPIREDYDLLWNGACGAQVGKQNSLKHLIPSTLAAFQAYRDALDVHDPTTFPGPADPWRSDIKERGYRMIDVGDAANPSRFHLTDGRSCKTGGGEAAVLGPAQMSKLASSIFSSPTKTVHIVASGSVFEARHGETRMSGQAEHDKMLELARDHRILLLSGDVHENRFAVPYPAANWSLFEATSSGASLRTSVTVGALRCNWGLWKSRRKP